MRFVVVATFVAGAVAAHARGMGYGEGAYGEGAYGGGAYGEGGYGKPSTVYQTDVKTITSCGPAVPDCPAATETAVPEPVIPEPVVEPEPEPEPEHTYVPTHGFNHSSPYPVEDTCGGVSVKTISTSITTVLPTVIYETVDIPCTATATASVIPTGGYASPSTGPSTTTPVFTGGAASMGVSFAAAAAGLVALLA